MMHYRDYINNNNHRLDTSSSDTSSLANQGDYQSKIMDYIFVSQDRQIHRRVKSNLFYRCDKKCRLAAARNKNRPHYQGFEAEIMEDDDSVNESSDEDYLECDKMEISSSVQAGSSIRRSYQEVEKCLSDLASMEFGEYLKAHTSLIKLHLKHTVEFSTYSHESLLLCVKPSLIDDLFTHGLVNPKDAEHVACLLSHGQMFRGLVSDERGDESMDESDDEETQEKHAFEVIMSLSILIHKIRCLNSKKEILDQMNRDLLRFIVFNETKENVRQMRTAFTCLFNSLILNGILSPKTLSDFLATTEDLNRSYDEQIMQDIDSSEDDWPSSDDEDDSENEQQYMQQLRHQRHRHHRPVGVRPPPIAAPGAAAAAVPPVVPRVRTIGDILSIKASNGSVEPEPSSTNTKNDQPLTNQFPLSLKNLTRIVIKNNLTEYTPNSVERYGRLLPSALKDFLLFRGEINYILKLTNQK